MNVVHLYTINSLFQFVHFYYICICFICHFYFELSILRFLFSPCENDFNGCSLWIICIQWTLRNGTTSIRRCSPFFCTIHMYVCMYIVPLFKSHHEMKWEIKSIGVLFCWNIYSVICCRKKRKRNHFKSKEIESKVSLWLLYEGVCVCVCNAIYERNRRFNKSHWNDAAWKREIEFISIESSSSPHNIYMHLAVKMAIFASVVLLYRHAHCLTDQLQWIYKAVLRWRDAWNPLNAHKNAHECHFCFEENT